MTKKELSRTVGFVPFGRPDLAEKIIQDVEARNPDEICVIDIRITALNREEYEKLRGE